MLFIPQIKLVSLGGKIRYIIICEIGVGGKKVGVRGEMRKKIHSDQIRR